MPPAGHPLRSAGVRPPAPFCFFRVRTASARTASGAFVTRRASRPRFGRCPYGMGDLVRIHPRVVEPCPAPRRKCCHCGPMGGSADPLGGSTDPMRSSAVRLRRPNGRLRRSHGRLCRLRGVLRRSQRWLRHRAVARPPVVADGPGLAIYGCGAGGSPPSQLGPIGAVCSDEWVSVPISAQRTKVVG